MTADGWSARTMREYFAITIHWVGSDWKLHSSLLDFVYLPAPHNQWSTSELILKTITEFKIHTKVKAIATDSGSEMRPAMNHVRKELNSTYGMSLDEDWHLRCVCHIMNRGVSDCEALMQKQLSLLRTLLKTVRSSTAMRQDFKNIQVRFGKRHILEVPNLDVDTRWNSTF